MIYSKNGMHHTTNCPFCTNNRFQKFNLLNLNTADILFETKNIWVQVDIAPLCVGHILIITTAHYLNFFETPIYIKQEVLKLKEKIKEVYQQVYHSDVLFFEHGSANPECAGASIDHANIHCIPYQYDISASLNELLGKPLNCDILSFSNFHNEYSYIYLESRQNGKLLYKVNKLPSQFLRKILSQKLGNNKYLWQDIIKTNINQKRQIKTLSD